MKKCNLRLILIDIFCFIVLFFPFNCTIAGKIYPMYSLTYISVFISLICLLFLCKKVEFNRVHLLILLITMIIASFEFFTNKYVNHAKKILFTIYLFLPFVISLNKDILPSIKKCLKIFAFEHLFFTYLAAFCKPIYKSLVLPFLDSVHTESLSVKHFNSGFNPGLTTHYSTNGMYLSVFCIYFWSNFLINKTKKNIILTIVSFVALLLTGKRGHLLFTIMTCLLMYIAVNREKIPKKVGKLLGICGISVLLFFIVSSFVPQVTIAFERVAYSVEKGEDLLTGRGEFYSLAFDIWKKSYLFGAGWGSFSNYYQIYLFNRFGVSYLDAHNVYIQLLCETGIIGASLLIGLMYSILFKTYKIIKRTNIKENCFLNFSLGYQLFFLLYCFSGNPLYDAQCYVMYFMCIGITFIFYIMEMKKNEENRIIDVSQSS